MTASTPDDLAVAFRSLERRQREAIGDADLDLIAGPLRDLQRHVASAATLLGVAPDPVRVAVAIEARPAPAWDVATLDALRSIALDMGRSLRELEAIVEEHAD